MEIHTRRLRQIGGVVLLLGLLFSPGLAPAKQVKAEEKRPTLVVDKLGDTISAGDTCDGGASNCPLRKAIQLSANADDTIINFDPAIFTPASSPIQLNSPLDTVTRQGTKINGTGATVKITFNTTTNDKDTIFRLGAHDIVLENLTIYGASQTNIEVFQRADRRITVRNNIIGVATANAACPNPNQTQNGIYVSTISPGPNDNSAIYIYNNRIECHNSATSGTGGIIVDGGRRVFVGINESNQTNANTVRGNRNGISLYNTQANIIKGNTVIDNSQNGISLVTSGAASPNNNRIEDNLIGTLGTSTTNGNRKHGISLQDSPETFIKNNVIAGNKKNGISITGDSSTNTKVESNFIGVDRNRAVSIPNGDAAEPDERLKNGIYLGEDPQFPSGFSRNTTIGGTVVGQLNIIGSSVNHGILIDNSDNNTILFNDIGFASGNNNFPLPNGRTGIKIMNGATGNIIGQEGDNAPLPLAPQANFIWRNTGAAIEINGADGNKIYGNSLRFNAKGVQLINADENEIYRTRIVENTGAGISEETGSDTNLWSEISTSANGGGGIDKTAGTPSPSRPQILSAQRLTATSYRIQGTRENGAVVEVYLGSLADPDEGSKFVGRTAANVSGTTWSIDVTIPSGSGSFAFLATQTLGSGTSRRTSEFSGLVLPKIYVPLVRKQ